MAGLWNQVKEQAVYLLKGPGSNTPSRAIVPIKVEPPPLRTSLVFESHIQEAGKGFSKSPQTISSAWDERDQYGDTQRSWQGLTAQDRKTIMLDIYLNNPWVSACVDVISKRIFSGGYVVEKVDEEAPDNDEHEDQLHEFALRINPEWDFNQLGRALITDELIFGESYAEMTEKAGQPWQLFKVDCIPMGFQANKFGQIERFYQEMQSSRKRNYLDPKDIIRWWFPHPRASIDPFAPSEKVSDAVLLDKKMTTWTETFFRKGTKFPFSVEGVGDQDEAQRFLAFFLQNFTGEKNGHAPFVTWGNAKLVPLAAQKLDMDFQQGLDRMRTIVFAAFGVPPAAVSIIESGNIGGGTGEDQDKSLIFNACDPVKGAFFEKLNDRIVKRGMGITDYRYSARYADYRSDESVAKVEDMRLKNGSRTVDEVRAESGKRPYKEGGSVPFIWSTKEVVPLARLDDLEDEQRQNAQVALDTAQANADLAQTKAKQAKEPPEPTPPALLNSGQQNVAQNATGQQKQPAKPDEQNGKKPVIKQPQKSQSKQESQGNTGAMVALMIPPEIGQQIAIAGGEPVEDLHITLVYLGDAADLRIEPEVLKAALQVWAANNYALQGRIAGLGRFDGPEDEPSPIIALPDIPGLPEFRQSLVHCLQSLRVDVNDEHGYTPHITLMYQDVAMSMPIANLPQLDLFFNAICLVVGDERTYFPLLGQKSESQEAVKPTYWVGKTEPPQWTDPEMAAQLAQLKEQGVYALTWKVDGNPCKTCLMNDKVTVRLGTPFPSGHILPKVHPKCECQVLAIHGIEQEQQEQDKDATQKLPVIKRLTDSDLWEGRM